MAKQGKDTGALETRIAQLERALTALSQGAATSENQSLPALQRHFELLLGEVDQNAIDASLQLLGIQLGCYPLSLWSVTNNSAAAGANEWTVIASDHSRCAPEVNPQTWHSLATGQYTTQEPGALLPIQVRQETVAVLSLPKPLDPSLRTFAQRVSALLWEAYERSILLASLREREKRFRYAMQASRDGLWDWDLIQNKIYFSSGYLRMLGYDYDRLPGTLATLQTYFIHPDDLSSVMQELNAAIANQREHVCLEHRLLHRDGRIIWVNCQCLLVEPDNQGRATRLVGTNSDITQSIADKQALIQAKAQAELASQTKSKFLASMSHEIRTPMNAILGLGHLLQDTLLDDQQKSYLGSINSAAGSLLQTVNQVFDYAKLETGNIILDNTHFDLEQIFERLSRMFESTTVHKPVNIIFDIADDVPRFLRGDAVRLGHIISHLVNNALQYSHSDEVVVRAETLTVQSDIIELKFSIIDHGRGLSADSLKALQADLSEDTPAANMGKQGFGLQICKLLVGLMKGELDIHSQPGQGSTFAFSATFEHSQIGDRNITSGHLQCHSLRLLVIDDNQLALDILAKSAGKLIDHVDTASSAEQALEKIKSAEEQHRPYDLLLLDYKMPLKNGLEAAKEIKRARNIKRKPKVFLVSSFQRDEIFSKNNDTSYVDDFLSKPVSESRLFDAICRALPECLSDNSTDTEQKNYANLSGKSVLLVEDNLVNQQVACGMMKKVGIKVTTANNGEEALKLLSGSTQFDAVLMDIEMPVLDGISATLKIRRIPELAKLPIIAVTAQAMSGDRERCLSAGMNEYISKPIKPHALYQTLSDLLNGQSIAVKQ